MVLPRVITGLCGWYELVHSQTLELTDRALKSVSVDCTCSAKRGRNGSTLHSNLMILYCCPNLLLAGRERPLQFTVI